MTPSPSSYTTFRDATLAGQKAAIVRHMRLGLSYDDRVDVFAVIENEPIWLLFQRLDRLFGAYCSMGGTDAVLIHAGHGLATQRFTAAHEYGHHVLGHQPTLDEADAIHGGPATSGNLDEVAAQAFAGEFLMPVGLFDRCRTRLGIDDDPTPLDAYQLSLELGTSLPATRTRLDQLNRITASAKAELDDVTPKRLKQLAAGRGDVGRADVWTVDKTSLGRHLTPHTGDELHVRFAENPSTGYRWSYTTDGAVEFLDDRLDVPSGDRLDRDTVRHLAFRTTAVGTATVVLELGRERSSITPVERIVLEPTVVEAGPPWDEPGVRPSMRTKVLA